MTRESVLKAIQERLRAIGVKELQRRVGEKFFDMDEVVKVLYTAIISGKNIILYGPGGFGKTEVVKEFLKQADINSYVIMGYEDMDVEGLLGIPNIDKMMKESVYEIAFDKTPFVKDGVLILEEFLDVNPKTAISLKDILTSGGYRQGDKFTESLISSVIICSNKSPYEMSTDNSTSAFYLDRFPIVFNLVWEEYSYNRYFYFIQKVVGDDEFKSKERVWEVLAELVSRSCVTGNIVSPRIVKDTIHILQCNDYDLQSLTVVNGINTDILYEVTTFCAVKDELFRITKISSNINNLLAEILSKHSITQIEIMDYISKLKLVVDRLSSMTVTDEESIRIVTTTNAKVKQVLDSLWNKVTDSVHSKEDSVVNSLFIV